MTAEIHLLHKPEQPAEVASLTVAVDNALRDAEELTALYARCPDTARMRDAAKIVSDLIDIQMTLRVWK